MNNYIDAEEIRRAISLLKPNNELYEVRIIGSEGSISSGYFRGSGKLIEELEKQDLRGRQVYFTLQRLNEACEARIQWEKFVPIRGKMPTTADGNIVKYEYIPIDIDPARLAGISSSNEELEEAKEIRASVIAYMSDNGFDQRIEACSGNGYHLLYKAPAEMPVDECETYIKNLLNRLDQLFGNDAAHVDGTNYNPARIFKLYGTLAQKGRSTATRPHRMARIERVVNWHNE